MKNKIKHRTCNPKQHELIISSPHIRSKGRDKNSVPVRTKYVTESGPVGMYMSAMSTINYVCSKQYTRTTTHQANPNQYKVTFECAERTYKARSC